MIAEAVGNLVGKKGDSQDKNRCFSFDELEVEYDSSSYTCAEEHRNPDLH